MPILNPMNDRPTVPGGHPGPQPLPQPIEMEDVDGEMISAQLINKILIWGHKKRRAMNIPQDQGPLTLFGLACLDMMDAGMQGDLAKGAVAFKSGLGNFFDHERRDERSEQRAAERLGAEARTEARTEAEGRMVDALKALTSEKKEP